VGEARGKEVGRRRRGMGLRLGVDSGVASTPKVGGAGAVGEAEEEEGGRREQAWGFA
jgi:hypothetical protein